MEIHRQITTVFGAIMTEQNDPSGNVNSWEEGVMFTVNK